MSTRKLTPKQARFVEEYLRDLSAAAAARRAGYSARTAEWIGPQLLGKTHVGEAVRGAMAERSKRCEIEADRVLRELAKIAFYDPRRVMNWGPLGVTLIASDMLTADDAAIVAEATHRETQFGTHLSVKLHDKLRALELLGRHLGMFNDTTNVRFPDGPPSVQFYLPSNGRDPAPLAGSPSSSTKEPKR